MGQRKLQSPIKQSRKNGRTDWNLYNANIVLLSIHDYPTLKGVLCDESFLSQIIHQWSADFIRNLLYRLSQYANVGNMMPNSHAQGMEVKKTEPEKEPIQDVGNTTIDVGSVNSDAEERE